MKQTWKHLLKPVIVCISLLSACNDKDLMNEETDSSMFHMRTWEDAQSSLDNIFVMCETPVLPEISADDIFIPLNTFWKSQYPVEANAYLWQPDIFGNQKMVDDWFVCYQQVMYGNAVLEAIPQLPRSASQEQQNQIKGSALFVRSHAYFQIAVGFAGLYSSQTLNDPGIPLRETTDPGTPTVRATIKETYDRIIADLKEACQLLPDLPDSIRKNRPSRPAACALLSRVFLFMGDYQQAKLYADSCLHHYNVLTDYNDLSGNSNPFAHNKEEVLYETNFLSDVDIFYLGQCYADSALYAMYANNDLRKNLYFTLNSQGLPVFRHSKTGNALRFSGIATDELYLTRAECHARAGRLQEAIQDLLTLMRNRYLNGHYESPAVMNDSTVLEQILNERRRELPLQGLRWMDIRRLNREIPSITLKRWSEGKEYILPPGDKKFILPIPPGVLAVNPTMQQNPR